MNFLGPFGEPPGASSGLMGAAWRRRESVMEALGPMWGPSWTILATSRAVFELSRVVLEPSWEALESSGTPPHGSIWTVRSDLVVSLSRASRKRLRSLLGPVSVPVGGRLGVFLGGLSGASWGLLGGLLGRPGGLLVASRGLLGTSWSRGFEKSAGIPRLGHFLEPSWGRLGPSWGHLGPS